MIDHGFKVGDRVRLKVEEAEGWQAPYRNFAKSGRAATIIGRQGRDGPWLIRFDVLRGKSRPHTTALRDKELTTYIEPLREDTTHD